jgi:hypothetical protein
MSRRWLTAALVLLFASGRASAQAPWEGDARLDRRVTVEAEGIPMRGLLARLSEITGVALSARGGIEEDKVIVFERRRPLRELLADVAALFDATWERVQDSASAPARYELFLGRKAQNWASALAREAMIRLAAHMDEYVRALALAPEELARRPEGDPLREYLSAPNNRTGIELYSLLSPEQREMLWSSRRLATPYAGLTEPQQRAIADIMRDLISRLENAQRMNPNARLSLPRVEDLAGGTVQFRVRRMGGQVMLLLQLPGTGIPLGMADAQSGFLLPPHGDPYDPRHPVPTGSLPDPAVVRTAIGEGLALADRLRRLTKDTEWQVVADYYRSRPLAVPPSGEKASMDTPLDALDALCREPGYLWWRRGGALLLRKRDWFLQRPAEVPDRFYLDLSASLLAHGGQPSIADLLRLRSLTPAQVAGMNSLRSPVADESLLDGLGDMLALIAALPSGRAGALFTPEGIVVAPPDMTPGMRASLSRFAAARDILQNPEASGPLTIRTERTLRSAAASGTPACTQVEIRWNLSNASGTYYLFLPHSLPDDRRDRTRVEKAE